MAKVYKTTLNEGCGFDFHSGEWNIRIFNIPRFGKKAKRGVEFQFQNLKMSVEQCVLTLCLFCVLCKVQKKISLFNYYFK